MALVFYTAPNSSASPVSCALAELGVPHETVTFDLKQGEQRKPDFLALNPNGKVPTLVVDGVPMFEGLAILIYLGDRHGVAAGLWPAPDDPARLSALSWCSWAYVSYVNQVQLLAVSSSSWVSPEQHNAVLAEQARKELNCLIGLLDARLGKQKFMLGNKYSLVDLVVASIVGYGVIVGAKVDDFEHVKAWLLAFQRRDAFKAT